MENLPAKVHVIIATVDLGVIPIESSLNCFIQGLKIMIISLFNSYWEANKLFLTLQEALILRVPIYTGS